MFNNLRKGHFVLTGLMTSLLLMGCADDPEQPITKRPAGSISILGYDAELIKAKVSVYTVDDRLRKVGEPIFVGVTDDFGRAVADGLDLADQYLLTEVGEEGYYFEESTGIKVELDPSDKLTAVQYYKAGDALEITASGFTHIATSYAQCLIAHYSENETNAMAYAGSAFTALTSVDIFTTKPLNPSLQKASGLNLDKALTYGILHAAVSKFMELEAASQAIEPHSSNYRSIDFYKFAAKDIALDNKCALDGVIQDADGEEITIGLGSYEFSENTYRVKLARAALEFVRSEQNKTAVSDLDFLPVANIVAIAENSRLFNGVDPTPLDDEGPNVVLPYNDDHYFGGVIDYGFSVKDYSGVHEVELFLDGVSIGKRINDNEPIFNGINTAAYSDGEHTFKIIATDNQYVQSETIHDVVFWNSTPIIEMKSELRTRELLHTLEFDLTSPVPVVSATINGGLVSVTESSISAAVSLVPGVNTIPVTATNSLGGVTETSVEVYVDRVVPSAIMLAPSTDYEVYYSPDNNVNNSYLSVLDLSGSATDPLYMSDNTVALDGLAVTSTNLANGKFSYIRFRATDDNGSQASEVITPSSSVAVKYSYSVDDVTVIDSTTLSPVGEGSSASTYMLPFTEEYLGDNWFLSSRDSEHLVTLVLTDIPGNEKEYRFEFRVSYFPGNPLFDFSEIETRFNNYSLLTMPEESSKEDVFEYEFKNDNDFPIKISLAELDETEIKHKFKTGYKENKALVVTHNEFEARCSQNGFVRTDYFGSSNWFVGSTYESSEYFALNIDQHYLVNRMDNPLVNGLTGVKLSELSDVFFHTSDSEVIELSTDVLPAQGFLVEDLSVVVNEANQLAETTRALAYQVVSKIGDNYTGYRVGNYIRTGSTAGASVCPLQSDYYEMPVSIYDDGVFVGGSHFDYTQFLPSMSLDSNSIIEKIVSNYYPVEGYPKTIVTEDFDLYSGEVSLKLGTEDYDDSEITLEPGDSIVFVGQDVFTSDLMLKGDECSFEYNAVRSCDQEVVLSTPTAATISVSPLVEGIDMPVSVFNLDAGTVTSVIN